MTDETRTFELTRRNVLAGIGGVGLASAAAGLGTTAYLNDTESFENNTITAGELDLKVDWQQAYYGPTEEWEFVNAHPDHDGDGEQSIVVEETEYRYSDESRNIVDALTCENLDHDFNFGEGQDSLVELGDVKPGDEGEITFSLHLCDNPGYLWMQAGNVEETGGANPEPEQVAEGDDDNDADLGENVDVQLWYDEDCDNRVNRADIMLTIDVSGSMLYDEFGGVVSDEDILGHDETTKIDLVEQGAKDLVQTLIDSSSEAQVGVVFFNGSSDGTPHIELESPLTDDLSSLVASGGALDDLRQALADIVGASTTDPFADVDIAEGTYIGEGVQRAQEELDDNGRENADAIDLVLSDGNSFSGGDGTPFVSPTDSADDARAASPGPATDVYTIGVGPDADDATLTEMAGAAESAGDDSGFFRDVEDPADIGGTFEELAGLFTSEVVFFEGTLSEALSVLSDGDGIPLDANRMTEGRECFPPGDGHCVGFAWELPTDVGNEIQGDTVEFDLGFYAEQCRHNDGSGTMAGT